MSNLYFNECVGQVVRQMRKDRGWTQQYFADCIGLDSKSAITRVEHGARLNLQRLEVIANEFGVRPSEIILKAERMFYREEK